MKILRIVVPLIIAVVLVLWTEFGKLSGVALYLTWGIGLVLAMALSTYFEVKSRMADTNKREND
ncbi:hypothetical protein [Pediococcus claussenii]|uniref:Membrane protein n=1 Tax=Pediococcus claussenii (strain ATCC BAA-344 / DSM 14800 / JCM 18046 / KCTC 3811 / LMG 21948 / P06) TaxID=701521 RepID=G8PDV4_PEDCP|nr:hypothetical protein [Pediococcus claussenii]AEV95439.1 putative membrane protein [Pediococcus claussenii ATCC BAA-344]ANZ68968.1 hypothetical protein AYR57_00910 [Pediococcus claussenii]ANZ70784.1 hypothetical protein AYR58_00910 [Pediococcus claussenii]KRN19081.1 hypothetical protein IV79_GL001743 [Pediococcus claussenii]